jgi:ABC-type transporter MlaC component
MVEGPLGPHWRERTSPERAEFVRLFADSLSELTSPRSNSPMLSDSRTWATRSKHDHAVVRTRITTNNGTVIPVNYRAGMTEGGTWRV